MILNKTKVIYPIFILLFSLPLASADWKIIPGSEWQKELRVWDAAPELKLDVSWEGARNSRNEAEGEGELTWKDEKGEVSIYSGSMVGGKREGTGTWHHRSGSKYVGQWSDNLKHGVGEYWLKDGSYYKGSFDKDKPHGNGYYVYVDGITYDGEFKDGKKQGSGTMTFPDGRVHKSNWIDDQDTNPPAASTEPYLILGIDTKKYALDGDVYSDDMNFNSPLNTLTYRGNWGEKSFSIKPHWPYLEKWQKGGPMTVVDDFEVSVQPVFLELRVFNPSSEKITISSAELEVDKSSPDNQPILAIGDGAGFYSTFSTRIVSFDHKIVNPIEIKFNILPESAAPKFESYKFKTTIPEFSQKTSWSFDNELKSLGVDVSLFKEFNELSADQEGGQKKKENLLEKIKKSLESFKEFEDNDPNTVAIFARVEGELTTNWQDDDGELHSHKIKFHFPKCFFVSSLEFGAAGPTSGNYEVMLETKGRNYVRTFPYKRTIAPGGNDRFGIKLASKESSYQKFRVRLTTTDGTELLSPSCDLRFLVPGGYDWDKGYIIEN